MQTAAMLIASLVFFLGGCAALFAAITATLFASALSTRTEWLPFVIYGPGGLVCFFLAWSLFPFTLTVTP